jgi:hypothetical protein
LLHALLLLLDAMDATGIRKRWRNVRKAIELRSGAGDGLARDDRGRVHYYAELPKLKGLSELLEDVQQLIKETLLQGDTRMAPCTTDVGNCQHKPS